MLLAKDRRKFASLVAGVLVENPINACSRERGLVLCMIWSIFSEVKDQSCFVVLQLKTMCMMFPSSSGHQGQLGESMMCHALNFFGVTRALWRSLQETSDSFFSVGGW